MNIFIIIQPDYFHVLICNKTDKTFLFSCNLSFIWIILVAIVANVEFLFKDLRNKLEKWDSIAI